MKRRIQIVGLIALVALLADSALAQTQVNSAQSAAQTAAWTSGTTINTAISASVANMSTVEASFNNTGGSITAGGIIFEASDDGGTTWYSVPAVPQSAVPPQTPVTTFTLTGSNTLWQIDVAGYTNFRIRLNPVITGAGTANVRWLASSMPSRPATNAQDNIVQFAGAPIVTGAGASGAGIPRVTVSNDSSLAANQSVNVNQISGSSVVTGVGASGAGIPRVTLSNDSVLANNQSMNLAQVGGVSQVTGGLAGSQATGGTGANNAAITQNPDLIGAEAVATGGNPSAATAGNLERLRSDLNGALFVRPGGPNTFNCQLTISSATTTQCQAAPAAGYTLYVTHVEIVTTTAGTGSTIQLKYGTGANCGTGTTNLSLTYPNTTATVGSSTMYALDFGQNPLLPAPANAVCVTQTATAGTSQVLITGYIAP